MSDDLWLRMAALKAASNAFSTAYERARKEAATKLARGEKHMPRADPDGPAIATVDMTNPKPSVTITDMAALVQWMATNYAQHVETKYIPDGQASDEIVAVLFAHAPHLLRTERRVNAEVLADMLDRTAKARVPVGPGGELDVPGIKWAMSSAVVRCTPTDDALPEVLGLWRSGRVDLEAAFRPQIEGETVDGDAH